MIAIINYGLGNLGSIANMLKVLNEKSVITADSDAIASADKIILPGVGAFDAGMGKLNAFRKWFPGRPASRPWPDRFLM